MRKFKEGNTEEPLSEKSINKHKDFDHLITNYQQVLDNVHKKPLYKSKKGFLLILLIILVITAIVISQDEKNNAPPIEKTHTQK